MDLLFLSISIKQAIKLSKDVGFYFIAGILLNLIFLPITIPFSLLMNTLELMSNDNNDEIFFIPKKFPCNWKFNYLLFVLEVVMYWLMLGSARFIYHNTFQLITFIWSFFETAGLVYMNIRYNYNEEERLKKKKKKYQNYN